MSFICVIMYRCINVSILFSTKQIIIANVDVAPIAQLRTSVIKIETFKGGQLMWEKLFSIPLTTALKGKNLLPLSFERSSHFEKGCN